MDYTLDQTHRAYKQEAIDFAKAYLQQDLDALDRAEAFNGEGWQACAAQGYAGLSLPKAYGGRGLSALETVLAMEGLGYACRDNGLLFSLNAHLLACAMPLLTFGNDQQLANYLPKLASGEWIAGHAASEPDAGSDTYSLKTTAQEHGDTFILNGHKVYVTNGPIADIMIVFASEDPTRGKAALSAFLVEKGTPGYIVERTVSKMGMRTAQMGELRFENCEIPAFATLHGSRNYVLP